MPIVEACAPIGVSGWVVWVFEGTLGGRVNSSQKPLLAIVVVLLSDLIGVLQ